MVIRCGEPAFGSAELSAMPVEAAMIWTLQPSSNSVDTYQAIEFDAAGSINASSPDLP